MTDHHDPEHPDIVSHNARWGLIFFFIYLILYALFVWMSAFRLELMAKPFLWGVNLAILYGMALIVAAFVMALLYMTLTRKSTEARR